MDGTGNEAAGKRAAAFAAFAVALVATAYPPLQTLHDEGVAGAFRYFASDAFYYLTVAERSAGARFYTFDGLFPTNGFHPLWQYGLTAAVAKLGLSAGGAVLFAFGAGIAATSVGVGLFAAAMQRVTGRFALALLAAVPGFYFLLLPPLDVASFSPWSFVNGMESPLSVLFFGMLAQILVSGRILAGGVGVGRALVLAAVLTALVLSRLDDVFLFVPFGAFLLLAPGTRRERALRTAAFVAIPTVCLGAYLLYNLSYAGVLLPVSGTAKNEGLVWGLLRNGFAVVTTLAPFVDPLGRHGATWNSEAWRVLQMVVPAAAAALWLAFAGRDPRRAPEDARAENRLALTLLCVYVLLKAGYNFALVRLWHQGPWYYPVSILAFDWIVAASAAEALDRLRGAVPSPSASRARWLGTIATVTALLLVLLHANAFVDAKRRGAVGVGNYRFWERRDAIASDLARACPHCGLVEFDDGILAYSLPIPVMNGLGLTLDAEATRARERGELLDLAWARGFRLLASLNYPMEADAYGDPQRLRSALAANAQLRGQKLDGWEFETAHVDRETGVAFVAFHPRGSGGEAPSR